MKITDIKTSNVIGARSVDIKIDRPIILFCGKNHSGKSSLVEAVKMALTGETVRVSLKKDYPQLITAGQTVGYAVVDHDGNQSAITLPNGAHEHTGERPPAILPYVLDAQRFASLPANDRRSFLFGLMGLRTDGDTVSARMLDKGCDPLKVDQIAPHLRAGFDAAHKEAQSNARDAKSAWSAVSGEAYGSVKAGTWKAPKTAFDSNRLRLDREELVLVTQQIEEGARAIGDMQGRARVQSEQSEKLSGLRQKAALFARAEAKLRKDEAELAEWQAKVENEARKGGLVTSERDDVTGLVAYKITAKGRELCANKDHALPKEASTEHPVDAAAKEPEGPSKCDCASTMLALDLAQKAMARQRDDAVRLSVERDEAVREANRMRELAAQMEESRDRTHQDMTMLKSQVEESDAIINERLSKYDAVVGERSKLAVDVANLQANNEKLRRTILALESIAPSPMVTEYVGKADNSYIELSGTTREEAIEGAADVAGRKGESVLVYGMVLIGTVEIRPVFVGAES